MDLDLHLEVLDDDFVRGRAPAADVEMLLDRRSALELLALVACARLRIDVSEADVVVTTFERGLVTTSEPQRLEAQSWGWDVLDADEREVWLVKHDEESRARREPAPHELTQIRIGVEDGRTLLAIPALETWTIGTSEQVLARLAEVRRTVAAQGAVLGETFGPLLLSRIKLEAVVGQADLVSYARGEFQFDESAAHRLAGAVASSLILRFPQLTPTLTAHTLAG